MDSETSESQEKRSRSYTLDIVLAGAVPVLMWTCVCLTYPKHAYLRTHGPWLTFLLSAF